MLDMVHVLNSVNTMAFECPLNGNVTVDFSIHNGAVVSVRFSKSTDIVLGGKQVFQNKTRVIDAKFANRILSDIVKLRMKYGNIRVSVDTKDGIVKKYSLNPEYTLNTNLLNAELKNHNMNQLQELLAQTA